MTVAKDNPFHIAVHSQREEPLQQLLDQVSVHMYASVLNTTNAYENTVLHEAAINHNIKAVKLLVGGGYVTGEQLLERNMSGHTPLFKAAGFGSTKVVKYLASRPNQTIGSAGNKKLHDAHRINEDGFSTLQAAVGGEHFGIPIGDDNYDDVDHIFYGEVKVDQNDGEVGDNQNPSPQGKISIPTSNDNCIDVINIPDGEVDQNVGEVGDNQNPSPKWKICKA
ncbi:hypothetical protein Ddye_019767 [Dipteronia dyeriana]|uniref:Ankyrin repeat protein n=1 Tax=Dipteronia dyeriana TaxID=168575 RepID=A0AAD9TYP9_9ROSI|nr:hypothetical protein Ddye_019767 [Dipteronia dyeriana]